MKAWSSHSYIAQGKDLGVDISIIKNAVALSKRLKYPNLPPIFTLNHLSSLTTIPYPVLRNIVERRYPKANYKSFRLSKRTKHMPVERTRLISIPEKNLKLTQRWIHDNVLSLVPRHSANFSFHPDGGIIPAATPHCECNWMVKVDITKYFESIHEPKVYKSFRDMGYEPLVSFELTRICTRVRDGANLIKRNRLNPTKGNNLPYTTSEVGYLPQGAPSSALLSNICTLDLDDELFEFALGNDLVYTRYADDIVMSSKSCFDRKVAEEVLSSINSILRNNGFWPNNSKSRIVPKGARKIVLGLLVDSKSPRLSVEYKRELKSHMHFITHRDVGLARHVKYKGFNSTVGFINYLEGKLSFASSIEPDWALPLKLKFKDVSAKYLKENGYI